MKALEFKIAIFLVLLTSPFAQTYSQNKLTREFRKEYTVASSSQLLLNNRYGSITVKDWDQKRIAIEILVTVENNRRENAERYLDFITIEFSEEGNLISAVTKIDEKSGKSGTRWFVINNDNKLSVDYTVHMPKNLSIDLSQRYGDVFINELTGEVAIDIRYGNLTVNRLSRGNVSPLASVSLAYSNGSISEANWLNLDLKYSEIKVDKAQAVVSVSKYSKISVEQSSSLVANSKYDRYTLGNLNNLVISGSYTNISVASVSSKIEIESRYGGVKIERIPPGFSEVNINSSYTNVNLGIDPASSYELKGNASYGNINYPSGAKVSRISNNNSSTVEGIVGKSESPSSKVTINTRYGNVNLVR